MKLLTILLTLLFAITVLSCESRRDRFTPDYVMSNNPHNFLVDYNIYYSIDTRTNKCFAEQHNKISCVSCDSLVLNQIYGK